MSDAKDSGENYSELLVAGTRCCVLLATLTRGYEEMLDEPGSGLMGVSFLDDVSFFDLVTRFLSDGLPLFVGLWPVIVDRKREKRILAAWPLAIGSMRTGSAATWLQSI